MAPQNNRFATESNGDLMTLADVAHELGCSVRTVQRFVKLGTLPQPVKFSRRFVRFNRAEVLIALQSS